MPSVRIPNIELVRAAGGVVVRDGLVLLVHRPAYDDWTLPKGKLEEGESWEDGALREVEEETGLRCELGEEVGRTRYVDSRGRNKEVRYFRMASDGEAFAQNEVDEVRWAPLDDAAGLLSYDRDRDAAEPLAVADLGRRETRPPEDVARAVGLPAGALVERAGAGVLLEHPERRLARTPRASRSSAWPISSRPAPSDHESGST